MKKSKQAIILFVLVVVVFSCDSAAVYQDQKDLNNHEWNKDSVLIYSFKADTIMAQAVKFSFNIRQNLDYAYRNMWMFVKIETPHLKPIVDTVNLEFMDHQGNWLSHVKGGTVKESEHDYRYALPHPKKGQYTITLTQGMRETTLKNVMSVGLKIQKIFHE